MLQIFAPLLVIVLGFNAFAGEREQGTLRQALSQGVAARALLWGKSAAKWQEMYEVYVADKYQLDVRKKFETAQNLGALQAIVERMLSVVEKGYWQASAETVDALKQVRDELVPQVLAENSALQQRAAAIDAAPAAIASPTPVNTSTPTDPVAASQAAAAPATPAATQAIEGRVLEESRPPSSQASTSALSWSLHFLVLAALALLLFAAGWWQQGRTAAGQFRIAR